MRNLPRSILGLAVFVAACGASDSPASDLVAVSVDRSLHLRAESISDSTVRLSWSRPAGAVASFGIERRGGAFASFGPLTQLAGDVVDWTSTELDPGTLYYFRVTATPADGSSPAIVETVGVSTSSLDEKPLAPEFVNGVRTGKTSVRLSWGAPRSTSVGILIERSEAAADFTKVASAKADDGEWTDESAPDHQRLRYRLYAVTQGGQSDASHVVEFTPVPDAPTDLLATASPSSAVLTWTDASSDETAFTLERDAGEGYALLANLPSNTNKYVDATVLDGHTYRWRVRAANGESTSAWATSNELSFSSAPPPVSTETFLGGAGGLARKVVVVGTYAYLAEGDELRIIGLTTISAPNVIGSLFTGDGTSLGQGDEILDLVVSGNRAYLAVSDKGLVVVDLSTPTAPSILSTLTFTGGAKSIALHGSTAYVASGWGGVRVVDLSSPATPVETGSITQALLTGGSSTTIDAATVRVVDGRLLVAHRGSGWGSTVVSQLLAYDLTTPTQPSFIGSASFTGEPLSIDGTSEIASVAVGSLGIATFDLTPDGAPSLAQTFLTRETARDVRCVGDHLFVADGLQGLTIVTRSISGTLAERTHLDTSGDARGIDLSATHAFIADGYGGLAIHAIGSALAPTTPSLAGLHRGFGSMSTALAVSGGIAYVADMDQGVSMIDVSTPGTPVLTAVARAVFDANDMTLAASGLIVADGDNGIVRLDSDPASATHLQSTGSFSNNYMTSANAVAVSGRHAYVANGSMGLFVIDVGTSASDPVVKLSVLNVGEAIDIAVSGDRAYIATGSTGVSVVDISDPLAPTLVTTLVHQVNAAPAFAARVTVEGPRLYVSHLYQGLAAYDLSGATPAKVGTWTTSHGVESVVVSGARVYALTNDGFARLDFSNLASITATRTVSLGVTPSDGELVGDLLHLSLSGSGVMTFRVP